MSTFQDVASVSNNNATQSQQEVDNIISADGTAFIKFRVRCEDLSYGEDVYLIPASVEDYSTTSESSNSKKRGIPLFTTPKIYPWYTTQSYVPLRLPNSSTPKSASQPSSHYLYRYAIHRSGKFYRWEQESDSPMSDFVPFHGKSTNVDSSKATLTLHHSLMLTHLVADESYIVSTVLGVTTSPPDIEKIQSCHESGSMANVADLLTSRMRHGSAGSSAAMLGSSPSLNSTGATGSTSGKKKVGFVPSHNRSSSFSSGTTARSVRRNITLKSTDGVIVASAFLPVHLTRSEDGEWTAAWDYEALLSMQTHLRVTRIGTVKWRGWHGNFGAGGSAGDSPQTGVPLSEREKVETCLRPFNCVPVWCDTVKFGEMYNGFCKGVLWSVLHNVTSVYSAESKDNEDSSTTFSPVEPQQYDDYFSEYTNDDVSFPIHGDGGREASLWSAYTDINRQFADVIIQNFNEGDIIWIQGFHLMILPSLLTRRIPMAKIGIFFHTPFPSSEIFRTLWCREDLLRGMLNADQVGFHLFEYARHFLTCCRRLLGLNYGMIPDGCGGHNLAVEVSGRHVTVTSIHAGIETGICNGILRQPNTLEKINSIRSQFTGKIIFCAIDRLESLKGIPLKMLGLERFLLRCPQYVGKVVLIQVGISAYERGDDYFKTKNEVLGLAANINKLWPGTVHFQEFSESQMRLEHRMALLRAADVALVTPIRDGLNLIPLEFTCAHLDALTEAGRKDGRMHRGLCILSEFSSCTRVMRGALHVNPWKVSEIANAFHQAVSMPDDERLRRLSSASEFVSRVTTQRWALAVMLDLKAVQKDTEASSYSGKGLGLGFHLVGMETGFNALDLSAVAKAYKNSKSRLILFDYGGTIVKNDQSDSLSRYAFVRKLREPSAPTPQMISTLKNLCNDPRNTVFVVSGKERHSLTKTLSGIPNLGLAAEHGMFIAWPTARTNHTRVWHTLVPVQDKSWRDITITIMEVYTSRTQGSYIEETEMKVLWQYRDADPEFGFLQAKELEDHLSNVLVHKFSVDVLHAGVGEGGFVEVRPKGVNKGVVSTHIIKNIAKFQQHRIDFSLVIGDDGSDEPMLSVMRVIGRRAQEARWKVGDSPLGPLPSTVSLVDVSSCDPYIHPSLEMFTCTVGKKPSAAKNYLDDVEDVQELLDAIIRIVARMHQFASMSDLRSLSISSNFDASTNFSNSDNLSRNLNTICAGVNTRGNKAFAPMLSGTQTLSLNQYLTNTGEEPDDDEDIFF